MINTEVIPVETAFEELLNELNSTAEEGIECTKADPDNSQPFIDWCVQSISNISARLPSQKSKLTALRTHLALFSPSTIQPQDLEDKKVPEDGE